MERRIATTSEQSQRLLRCGVSADTADMVETRLGNLLNRTQDFPVDETKETLVWSLSALIGLLPPSITDENGTYFQLQLTAYPHEEDCYKWNLSYYSIEGEISLLYIEAPDPIEACVSMIELLTANGYKLNEQ